MPRKVTPFIRKTFELLSDESLIDIIRWSNQGDSFLIIQSSIFESSILPKFFKHSKLNSFVRQLNTYGFKKIIKKDSKDLEFKHKLFLRGQESLLPFITRRSNTSKDQTKKEEEVYSTIKQSVEEKEFIKKLISDNERMAKELLEAQSKQLQAERELLNVRKDLLEAHTLLSGLHTFPRIPYNSSYPATNQNYCSGQILQDTFLDELLKPNQKNANPISDLTFNEDIFKSGVLETVVPVANPAPVDINAFLHTSLQQ